MSRARERRIAGKLWHTPDPIVCGPVENSRACVKYRHDFRLHSPVTCGKVFLPHPTMSTSRFFLFVRLALLLLLPAALVAKEVELIDFRKIVRDPDGTTFKCYEYTFGDWDGGKVMNLQGRGVLVQAPSGKGGLGENKTGVRFDQTPLLDLYIVIGNANPAKAINFDLTDKDGTEQTWQIPLEGLPKGTDQHIRLDLTKPSSEQKPGKTPGMDLKKVMKWQIRGDYSDLKVEVLLVRLAGQK